jgi:D-beta-D-heptose 7-phosphate kinase / D-beta-D-heptose 1-phosphate adenosyltransferase
MKIEAVKEILAQFPSRRILVVGDFYLDEYFHCRASKLSPEAPVPRGVVQHIDYVPGCAGNIALAFKSLGAQVSCAGVIGNDEKGMILRNKLLEQGVITTGLIADVSRITGVFSRVLAEGNGDTQQHIVRFDQENTAPLQNELQQKVLEYMNRQVPMTDLILVADYDEVGTGLVDKQFLQQLKSFQLPLAGMSREKIDQFEGFTLLFCNQHEYENANQITAEKIIVTQGKTGMRVETEKEQVHMQSMATKVRDVAGAGDVVASAFCLAHLTNTSVKDQVFIASHAAAVAIAKPGTTAATSEEIVTSIASSTAQQKKTTLNQQELREKVVQLQQEEKLIVFTNGYFDLIHAGHINFLKAARQQGDVLVVALNSDRSTRENKGEGRPILKEQERLDMISSMGCVDFVTVFDESTPLKIISLLQPDVLVKGGTYKNEEIVGKDIVETHGGKVIIIEPNGSSTTSFMERVTRAHENNR